MLYKIFLNREKLLFITRVFQLILILFTIGIGAALYCVPALHIAAETDRPRLVKSLLWTGYDIEARASRFKDSVAMTPVEWAASAGAARSTLVLINAGARPVGGRGALHVAAQQVHIDVVRTLLDSGVDPNLPSATGGSTALHWLIGSTGYGCSDRIPERMEIARVLLAHGADPNAHKPLSSLQIDMKIAGSGSTPLYDAVMRGCVDLIRLLMESGADKHAVVYGESILEAFKNDKIPARWASGSFSERDKLASILGQ
jgi:ankyrin repeat protein